jgi:hypothetical protein
MQRRTGILATDMLEVLLELVLLEWNHMLQKILQANRGVSLKILESTFAATGSCRLVFYNVEGIPF